MAARCASAGGITVRQVEDEIGVVNMGDIGAARCRGSVHVRYLRRRLCIDD